MRCLRLLANTPGPGKGKDALYTSKLAAYETGEEWAGFRRITVTLLHRYIVRAYPGD